MKEVTFFIEDVFPLIYLKLIAEGAEPMQLVKHLLVDEMQGAVRGAGQTVSLQKTNPATPPNR